MSDYKAGFVRCVDKLGRICIPIELRSSYEMNETAHVEMVPLEDGILLRTVQTTCVFCQKKRSLDVTFKGRPVCRTCLESLTQLQKNLDPQ